MGSTNTWTTVFDGLVRDTELAQVVARHLGLDLHRVEHLSRD